MSKQHIQSVTPTQPGADLIADLRQLRERITADRRGALIDFDGLFDELRDERDHELFGVLTSPPHSGA